MLKLQIPRESAMFSNSQHQMCYQIISHFQQHIYIITHQTLCPSASYHERIVSKQKLLDTAEKISPKDPLIKHFIEPIIQLLNDWTKDQAVCDVCKGQILAQDEFFFIICQLHSIIQRTKQGNTVTKNRIIQISNQIKIEIDNVVQQSFCINFNTFQIKHE